MNYKNARPRLRKMKLLLMPILAVSAFGLSFLSAYMLASRAHAHSYGFCDAVGGCRPDDLTHSSCWAGAGSNPLELGDSWNFYDNNTNLNMVWFGACGGGNINMRMNDNLTGGAFVGLYQCTMFNSAGLCINSTVQINNTITSAGNHRRAAWCHEIGHSVGLGHDAFAGTCMNAAVGAGTSQVIDAHDINHVNTQLGNGING